VAIRSLGSLRVKLSVRFLSFLEAEVYDPRQAAGPPVRAGVVRPEPA